MNTLLFIVINKNLIARYDMWLYTINKNRDTLKVNCALQKVSLTRNSRFYNHRNTIINNMQYKYIKRCKIV